MFIWTLMHELFGLFVGHLVGDFLLQTNWMAGNKRKSSIACFAHVLVYTATILAFSGWGGFYAYTGQALWLIPVIGLPHFVIDRFGLAAKYAALADKISPRTDGTASPIWLVIVYDQSLHAMCLFLTTLLLHWSLQWAT